MKNVFLFGSLLLSSCSLLPTEHNKREQSCDFMKEVMCQKIASCTPYTFKICKAELDKTQCGDNTSEAMDKCTQDLKEQKCSDDEPVSCKLLN